MRFFYKIFLSILLTAGLGVGGYGYWLINAMQDQRGITIEEELGNISNLLSSQLTYFLLRFKPAAAPHQPYRCHLAILLWAPAETGFPATFGQL